MNGAARTQLSVTVLLVGSLSTSAFGQTSAKQTNSGTQSSGSSSQSGQWGRACETCFTNTSPTSSGTISSRPVVGAYTPRTPAGSAYLNALNGFLNSLAARSATQGDVSDPTSNATSAPVSPLISVPHSPLIDADTFAHAGKDVISQNMDDLLDHCSEAVQYVESKDGLVGEFDKVFTQYKIRKDGLQNVQRIKQDLLDDTWWARSSGPDVAREVKAMCDLLGDVFGMVSPEGEVVKGVQQIENVTRNQEAIYDTVGKVREGVDFIKTAYDQKDDVHKATQKVAADMSTLLVKDVARMEGYGRMVPFLDFAQHLQERAKTQEEGYKLKVEVEYQVRRLDTQINIYQSQIDDYGKAIEAMNALHDTVISVCVPKSIAIGNGPNQ